MSLMTTRAAVYCAWSVRAMLLGDDVKRIKKGKEMATVDVWVWGGGRCHVNERRDVRCLRKSMMHGPWFVMLQTLSE